MRGHRLVTLSHIHCFRYSFGEPRIGNKYFAEFWGDWVPNGLRIVHADDLVPHLPPRGQSILLLTDFHHHKTEVVSLLTHGW